MLNRRDFIRSASTALAAVPLTPELLIQRTRRPVVISDYSGFEFKNGGSENAVDARVPAHHRRQGRARRADRRRQHPRARPARDRHRLRRAAQRRRRRAARRVVHARTDEARRCGRRHRGRAHAVAGREGGDGPHRSSSARRRRRAGVRARDGIQDRRGSQHRELAPAVARMEAPRRSRALARSEAAMRARPRTEAPEGPGRGGRDSGAAWERARWRRDARWCATG